MNRRTFLTVPLVATASALTVALAAGCGPGKPRALVLADGSGVVHGKAVDSRAKAYEKRTGRAVKILVVEPAQAITLASRGEADIAIVPMGVSLDTFLASEHGRVAGFWNAGGERLRVLEVDEKQHPKVDGKGARELASAFTATP